MSSAQYATPFYVPRGIPISPITGNILVADSHNERTVELVSLYSPAKTSVSALSTCAPLSTAAVLASSGSVINSSYGSWYYVDIITAAYFTSIVQLTTTTQVRGAAVPLLEHRHPRR